LYLFGVIYVEIIVGKTAGFCGGVKRSILESEKLLESNKKIYCLGELVHNKQVIDRLRQEGIIFVDRIEEVPDGFEVIFRAHGVPKVLYEEAINEHIVYHDLTCPKVLKIHELAEELVNNDYYVILIAQKDHPETIGTISYCNHDSKIISCKEDIDDVISYVKKRKYKKIAILSQTTFSLRLFNEICESLKIKLKDVTWDVRNTICAATARRQQETEKLASKVEAMIVIGGKNSSNTKKLYEVAKLGCVNSFIVETYKDLVGDFRKFTKIGVMAGASTPEKSITDIVDYLKSL